MLNWSCCECFFDITREGDCTRFGGMGKKLWLTAAKGLGFFVHAVHFKDTEFQRNITDPEHSLCFLKWGSYCKCYLNLGVICMYEASLVELHNLAYWNAWKVPHVFFAYPSSEPVAPGGWQERSRVYNH